MPLATLLVTLGTKGIDHNLANRPNWCVTKLRMAMELMGAKPFYFGLQALAGNRLNLDAWHGYQEVMLRTPVHPREVSFRFFLAADAYLYFVFNRPKVIPYETEYSSLVRLSALKEKPNAYFFADAGGKFLERFCLEELPIVPESWNTCRIVFHMDAIRLSINSGNEISIPCKTVPNAYLGFRGSFRHAALDNLCIVQHPPLPMIVERFHWIGGKYCHLLAKTLINNMLIASLVVFLVLLGSWILTGSVKMGNDFALSGGITLVLTLAPWVYCRNVTIGKQYPVITYDMEVQEREREEQGFQLREEEILRLHPPHSLHNTKTIIFLGTSQTWGSGAALQKQTFVQQVQDRLNASSAFNQGIVCLNGAVPGSTAPRLSDFYKNFLTQFPHKMLVIVLGCNDRNPAVFRESLEQMVRLARKCGAFPVLVVEAFSTEEAPQGTPLTPVFEDIAESFEVPLLNMHQAIMPLQDTGILWWDVIHPTSYGHACLADTLAPFLSDILVRIDHEAPSALPPAANGDEERQSRNQGKLAPWNIFHF